MPCPLFGKNCVWREYYCDTHQCYQPFYRFSRAHIEAGVRECIVCEEVAQRREAVRQKDEEWL